MKKTVLVIKKYIFQESKFISYLLPTYTPKMGKRLICFAAPGCLKYDSNLTILFCAEVHLQTCPGDLRVAKKAIPLSRDDFAAL
jgi:hypothetical protein